MCSVRNTDIKCYRYWDLLSMYICLKNVSDVHTFAFILTLISSTCLTVNSHTHFLRFQMMIRVPVVAIVPWAVIAISSEYRSDSVWKKEYLRISCRLAECSGAGWSGGKCQGLMRTKWHDTIDGFCSHLCYWSISILHYFPSVIIYIQIHTHTSIDF